MSDADEVDDEIEARLDYDFEQSIGYWIVLTSQAYQKALNAALAPHGITFRQSQVLGWLALEGQLSQVELAARMMIEPATLVGILDRMERDQLILRLPASDDRRRKVIRVRREAEAVWDKVVACARRVRSDAVQGLSERQISVLRKTLQAVFQNLSEFEMQSADSEQAPVGRSQIGHGKPRREQKKRPVPANATQSNRE